MRDFDAAFVGLHHGFQLLNVKLEAIFEHEPLINTCIVGCWRGVLGALLHQSDNEVPHAYAGHFQFPVLTSDVGDREVVRVWCGSLGVS